MERLVRKQNNIREAVNKEIESKRREVVELEFQKLHEIAVLETLEQLEILEKPTPKNSMMTKFMNAVTPTVWWFSSIISSSTSKDADIVSTGSIDTIDTQVTDATEASEFVTLD